MHYQTWTAKQWQKLFKKEFGEDFLPDHKNPTYLEKIKQVPDEEICAIRMELKKLLINYLKERIHDDLTERQENPNLIFETIDSINDKALIIGFARRFATYKRAYLLFNNLERLSQIVNIKDKPVLFVFAGKAHPHDKAGQDVIKRKVLHLRKSITLDLLESRCFWNDIIKSKFLVVVFAGSL